MTLIQITDREKTRLFILALLMFAGLGLLAFAIWFIQLGQGHLYLVSQDQQSVRRVRLPTVRGKIVDRNGICLADNQPDYGICIYLEELRRSDKKRRIAQKALDLVQQLAPALEIEPQTTLKQINAHLYNRKPLPMPVWRHINHKTMARFAEISMRFPAADVEVYPKRIYPYGASASHLIGYVGTSKAGEDDEPHYHYYLPDMEGKRGLEKVYNKWLAGSAGGRLVRIDVAGFKHDETCIREPVPGSDLRLSIDLRLQRIAEQAIADVCGAVVLIDPNTGDILAMASAPNFNLNLFYPYLSVDSWQALAGDERKPLFNRAVSGSYAPGSTFKPLIAIAALTQGKAAEDTILICDGYFELGGQTFSCHMGKPHGSLDIIKALEVSCNVFFYKLGLQCGYDALYHMAAAAGFGQKTGLDLDGESAGFLPSKTWKRQAKGEIWYDGDTCNISVGQGALLVTPLQMAVFTAAIANGGRLYRPRLVIGQKRHDQNEFEPRPPVLERDLHWSAAHLSAVKEGMRRVICEPDGTGRLACLPQVVMAGKTGTAEFGRKGSGQQHGWMILFAPFNNPRYAVAMIIDEAVGSGGASVGP
ncbi:MAG: penicillin-binding protein 2, partial [Kiritimatiellia bacterium]|nr:penicillin-binding protein 2 [Kiritimatiellia bacterium]